MDGNVAWREIPRRTSAETDEPRFDRAVVGKAGGAGSNCHTGTNDNDTAGIANDSGRGTHACDDAAQVDVIHSGHLIDRALTAIDQAWHRNTGVAAQEIGPAERFGHRVYPTP